MFNCLFISVGYFQFDEYQDSLAKECSQVTEKINQIEAECLQTFQNNKFNAELTQQFMQRIQSVEKKLSFLTSQPFTNELCFIMSIITNH